MGQATFKGLVVWRDTNLEDEITVENEFAAQHTSPADLFYMLYNHCFTEELISLEIKRVGFE